MNAVLQAALSYAARGWFVFPLTAGSKIPLAGSRGHLDATCDEEQIRAWFADGTANIGVDLERSGLLVLDVDVATDTKTGERKPGLESLAEIDAHLAPTRMSRTGRGGLQAFFERGDAEATRKIGVPTEKYPGKGASGLDVLSRGYVLLPPSRIDGDDFAGAAEGATGEYRWIVERPLAPCPAFLAAHTRKSTRDVEASDVSPRGPASARVIAAARARLDRHGPAVSGRGGNAHTRSAWGILVHGFALAESEALPLLLAWNLTCEPPWDIGELRRGPARSGQHWDGAYGADRDACEGAAGVDALLDELEGVATSDDPFADGLLSDLVEPPTPWQAELARARADVARTLAVGDERAAAAREPLFTPAGELFVREYPPTPWLVRGLITERGTTLLGGEPKTSKTWGLVEIAVAVATGTLAFGQHVTGPPKRVAYFFAEDHAEFVRNRLRALCASRGVEGEALIGYLANLHVRPRGAFLDLTKDEDLAWIIASCRMIGGVDLLILEPLRDIHSAEEDSSDDMANVMRRLRALGEILECTPAAAHHMNKGSGDTSKRRPGQRSRGSGAIHGAVDSGIYFEDLRGDGQTVFTNRVTSEIKGARGAGVFDLTLTITDDPKTETAVHAAWTKGDASAGRQAEFADRLAAVKAAIAGSPDQCMTKTDLKKIVGGNGQTSGMLIEEWIAAGELIYRDKHPIHGAPIRPAKIGVGVSRAGIDAADGAS